MGAAEPAVAAALGLSQRQLQRQWRAHGYDSLETFLMDLRLQNAVRLLTILGSVKEAALLAGYLSVAPFCREFARSQGISLGRFFRRYRDTQPFWSDPEMRSVRRTMQAETRAFCVGLTRPTTAGGSLDATYGTTGSADYYFSGGLASTDSWTGYAVGQTKTVVIPSGSESVTISVATRADNLTENNVIVLEVVPDSNTSTPAYSVGTKSLARVLLYDGPEFNIQELTATAGPSGETYASSAAALNDGVANTSGGGWLVRPQIVGNASWSLNGVIASRGVLWDAGTAYPAWNFGTGFVPGGIGWQSAPNGQVVVAGSQANQAWRMTYNGVSWVPTALAHIAGGSGVSGALGINPGGNAVAGFSRSSANIPKPVVWNTGVTQPFDLIGNLYLSAQGQAAAINASGVTVGDATGRFFSSPSKRGFRTPGGTLVVLAAGDDLPPPTSSQSDAETVAVSINSNGQAVGTYKFSLEVDRGAFWSSRSGDVNPTANGLGAWRSPVSSSVFDSKSYALGIADSGRIVGRSRSGSGSDRAVLRNGYLDSWKDLNDRHFVHGAGGWVLQSATAINNTGYIVGNGTLNGTSRGFVLIPRSIGN